MINEAKKKGPVLMGQRQKTRSIIDAKGARGLEHLLGIKEMQINPQEVDMAEVKPTVDMGMGGYALLHDFDNYKYATRTVPLDGIGGVTASWISYVNAAHPADLVYDSNHHFVPFGIDWYLTFDANGIAAFAPAMFFVWVRLANSVGNITRVHQGSFRTTIDAKTYFPGYESCEEGKIKLPIVPCSCNVSILVQKQTPGNFPPNTDLQISVLGLQVPYGAPIPRVML